MNGYERAYTDHIRSRQWITNPLCAEVGTEVFFPPDEENAYMSFQNETAQRICLGCESVKDCAAYAILNRDEYGIWGSLSTRQIRDVNKEYRSTTIGLDLIAEREVIRNRKRLNHRVGKERNADGRFDS